MIVHGSTKALAKRGKDPVNRVLPAANIPAISQRNSRRLRPTHTVVNAFETNRRKH